MIGNYDCESVEQARKMFPELKNCICTEIQFLDGPLFLFTKIELSQEDRDLFSKYTKDEIKSIMSLSSDA